VPGKCETKGINEKWTATGRSDCVLSVVWLLAICTHFCNTDAGSRELGVVATVQHAYMHINACNAGRIMDSLHSVLQHMSA
jgi:hypothetical protein